MSRAGGILLLAAAAGVAVVVAGSRSSRAGSSLALVTLEHARADLLAGVQEVGGYNRGPAIEAYAAPFGLTAPLSWCSVAFAAWVRRAAAELGLQAPVGSPLAQETMRQFQRLGLWTPRAELTEADVVPGAVPIWSREPDPARLGHIGIITETQGRAWWSIEGNSGPAHDRVARMARSLDEPALLGFGQLEPAGVARELEAARSLELGGRDDEGEPFRLAA